MEIKYKVNDKVYMYSNRNILETIVRKIVIDENIIKYSVDGIYHNVTELDIFSNIDDLLNDLRTRIVKAEKLKDKADNTINKAKSKIKEIFNKE